jgi:hypothetical protein
VYHLYETAASSMLCSYAAVRTWRQTRDHQCPQVCRVAEFFEMRSLRMECICMIGKKATVDHLPLLTDLCSSMSVVELAPVVSKLRVAQRL